MSVIREIFKSIGIYNKSLIFFLVIFAFSLVIFLGLKISPFSAEETIPENIAQSENISYEYTLTKDGRLKNSDGKVVRKVVFEDTQDSLSFVVIQETEGTIDELSLTINLEKANVLHDINLDIKSDGIMGDKTIFFDQDNAIKAQVFSIASGSVVTAVLTIPKGYFDINAQNLISSETRTISSYTLLGIAMILPLITLASLLYLLIRRNERKVSEFALTPHSTPPDQISPAIIGVLYRGKIGPREIAATLIDLANRGFLHMYKDRDKFQFAIPSRLGSEKFKKIRPFEKFLLAKIFEPSKNTSSTGEIGYRIGQRLYSRKITAALLDIYQQAVLNGYFSINPAKMHSRYKAIGLIEFFLGLMGLIGSFFVVDPEYQPLVMTLFGSVVISSLLIFALAPTLPQRTPHGANTLRQWLGFRKYLKKPSPIEYKGQIQQVYMQYLPYAMVLGVEVEWANRFAKSPFNMPEWFDAPIDITNIEDFANNIYPLVGYIGSMMIQSKVPVVD